MSINQIVYICPHNHETQKGSGNITLHCSRCGKKMVVFSAYIDLKLELIKTKEDR